jgi:hypothetical protein
MGEKEEKVTQDRSVHIGRDANVAVINPGEIKNSTVTASGTGYTTTQTITIDKMYLEKMPKEYAESLQAFTADLNKHLNEADIPAKTVERLQSSANEVAKETADIKPETGVSPLKKISIGAKLANLAKTVVKASPKYAETIVAMTPLAPFSKLVGEAFEKLVDEVLKEEKRKETP